MAERKFLLLCDYIVSIFDIVFLLNYLSYSHSVLVFTTIVLITITPLFSLTLLTEFRVLYAFLYTLIAVASCFTYITTVIMSIL